LLRIAAVTDTIFALSTGRLPSGVAVVRVSGPQTRSVLAVVAGEVPPPRLAKYVAIRAADGGHIDFGIILYFPAPHSFTGEDCIELHLHGGVATVSACLNALGTFSGLRQAEAGEFTKRAFLNGKIDLTEAEGLADLISAETEAQRIQALAGAEGGQRRLYEGWRQTILHARAMIEAEIDFTDEGDVPGSVSAQIWPQVAELAEEVSRHLGWAKSGEIVRSGLDVVILGAPNAGKSSLMNALARRDVSIITEEAGTTRDLVEVRLDLGGYRVNLTDTAGIRPGAGRVEAMGIERALTRAEKADLVLLVEDIAEPGSAPLVASDGAVWRIGLKADLAQAGAGRYDLVLSTMTGVGLESLVHRLSDFVTQSVGIRAEVTPIRERQVDELRRCLGSLRQAWDTRYGSLELAAEELREAGSALGRLTGRIDVEEMLGVIFSQFCVGK
jgi:tRNA modification GTPase